MCVVLKRVTYARQLTSMLKDLGRHLKFVMHSLYGKEAFASGKHVMIGKG